MNTAKTGEKGRPRDAVKAQMDDNQRAVAGEMDIESIKRQAEGRSTPAG